MRHPEVITRDPYLRKHDPSVGHGGVQPILALSNPRVDIGKVLISDEGAPLLPTKSSQELPYDVEDFDIAWSDLILGERIGAGAFFCFSTSSFTVQT